jgi:hypothetical protein
MCNDQDRFEYEKTRECWYFEEKYRSGMDHALRHDPEYIEWLEEKRKRDLLYQMRDTHQT